MEKAKKSKQQLAGVCASQGRLRYGGLIKKCAGANVSGADPGPLRPQELLSRLTLTEPGFSESPALMENKFREFEWSH